MQLRQDVQRRSRAGSAPGMPVAEAAGAIAAAGGKKAAINALAGADLVEGNPLLAAKLEQIDGRLSALEPPA